MKKLFSVIVGFIILGSLSHSTYAQEENNNGAFRISIGGEYVEPYSLPGNDPNIPPKPKRQFNTNSIFLNQILNSCETYETFEETMERFQKMNRVFYSEDQSNTKDFFTVVYMKETKEIVAVMDKGSGKRCNLLTNQFETDDLYQDEKYAKIWFKIEE